jgi:hypothetical protein
MKNDKPMCDSCTEKTDIIGRYLDEVMPKPKGVTSLGKSPLPSETNTHSTRPEHSTENQEEDEVEVYDPDSE